MTFTKKTWADDTAGGTPITAAELNRIETGVSDLFANFRWRGTWSSIQLLKAYDPNVNGTTGMTISGISSPQVSSVARSAALIQTGTLPTSSYVYRIGVRGSGFAPGNTSGEMIVTAPPGTTEVRFKHAFASGPGSYGQTYLRINGTQIRSANEVDLAWATYAQALGPGQTLDAQDYSTANSVGETYIGDLEFWGTGDPYQVNDLVFYSGRFYRCASASTSATPGADSSWVLLGGTRDLRWYCPPSWTSIDEFNDDTRDAAYTEVYPSGRSVAVAWTEGGDIQSAALAGGGASGDLQALMRPLGTALAVGDAIITAVDVMSNVNNNYTMAGIVLSDGVTAGAGSQLVAWYYSSNPANLAMTTSLWSYTNFGSATNLTADTPPGEYGRLVYMRLVRLSSTTWRLDYSPNGVSWVLGTAATLAITPTHVGVGATSFGTATKGYASFEFLRRVSGVT